jgi:hypothetical protein
MYDVAHADGEVAYGFDGKGAVTGTHGCERA